MRLRLARGYRDVGRVDDDVEHDRALLRRRDQRGDLLRGRAGIGPVMHLCAVEAVADIHVVAEEALQVHAGVER